MYLYFFEITVKKNTPFIPNSKSLAHHLERQLGDEEIIFPRNMNFEVTSWSVKKYKLVKNYNKTLKEIAQEDQKVYYIKLRQIDFPKKSTIDKTDIEDRIVFTVDKYYSKNVYYVNAE